MKQAKDTVKQIGNGDILGGIVNAGNVFTGTVEGLAGNIKTKDGKQATKEDIEANNFKSNNDFYIKADIGIGFNKSKQETESHTEKAVVTTIQGKDENSKITYNHIQNIDYIGTQAQDTKFVYNNVENITKKGVALHDSYSSSSKSSGISTGVTIGYGKGIQTEANAISISASKSKMNTNGTSYQNGSFVNVDEIHQNTKNMLLSGFHQEGGNVTGTIENLVIESKQNTSTTKGSSKGGSLSISPSGMPSGSANYSKTKGERKVVDNASTFIVGDGSNLKVGKVENTAGAIGTTGNGKLSIDEYIGHNLENKEQRKTKGGSLGISTSGMSSIGLDYADRKQEGHTKNTVIGNVVIAKISGESIHKDLETMTEITKEKDRKTNIELESQTIDYLKNPEKLKEDIAKAKHEIHDIHHAVDSTLHLQGKESRNVLEQLGEVRQARTIDNVIGTRLEIAKNKEDIAKAFEGVSKDLGYQVKVIYTDASNSPQLIGIDNNGNPYEKDGTAYVDEKTGINCILINSHSPINKTKSGLIGIIAEEQSHIIGDLEGKQKVVSDGSEKGLESLGKPTNDFFKNKYSENDLAIEVDSDGKDYSNVDFGVNVGDYISPQDRKDRLVYKKNATQYFPDGIRTFFGVGETASSIVRGGKGYLLLKFGATLVAIPEPMSTIVGAGIIAYGATEVGFSSLNAIEGTQDIIYGWLNRKEKQAVNPGKILLGEEQYILLDNLSLSAFPYAQQTANYRKERGMNTLRNGIDTKHIINGEVNRRKAVGGHTLSDTVRPTKDSKIIQYPNGVSEMKIEIKDNNGNWVPKKRISTMFPREWKEEKIVIEIATAYKRRQKIGDMKWRGVSSSGIVIEGFEKDDYIITAYPLPSDKK